jgi:hypothetical protein
VRLNEIASSIGISKKTLYSAIKNKVYSLKKDYTLDESMYIARLCVDTKITEQLIIDNYKKTKNECKEYFIEGTEKWFRYYETHKNAKCCNTCSYLMGKRIRNRDKYLRPFCNLYNKFIYKIGGNVYWQWCKSYDKSALPPVKWKKNNYISNIK